MKWIGLTLASFLLFSEYVLSQTTSPQNGQLSTKTLYMNADEYPVDENEDTSTSEGFSPENPMQTPFFEVPSTGNEAMEKVLELEGKIEKLEKRVGALEKNSASVPKM